MVFGEQMFYKLFTLSAYMTVFPGCDTACLIENSIFSLKTCSKSSFYFILSMMTRIFVLSCDKWSIVIPKTQTGVFTLFILRYYCKCDIHEGVKYSLGTCVVKKEKVIVFLVFK